MNRPPPPPSCPHLPEVLEPFRSGTPPCPAPAAEAYRYRLAFAQSLWMENKPAQALLQLNRAFAIDLDDASPAYTEFPWPYEAKLWIVRNVRPGAFLGNPVRHYQHYATRIPPTAALRDLRSARAWICFHLMRAELPPADYPGDEAQIVSESIVIPAPTQLLDRLGALGRTQELGCVARLLHPFAPPA